MSDFDIKDKYLGETVSVSISVVDTEGAATDALAKKFRKEALVTKAEQALEDYKAKESAFFDVTRKAAFDAFEAEKQAAKDILVSEWQDKEDYAKATSDWELTGYTVDWSV
jgi:N-acetyl-anhydromuramyl-L-alanine amidase AmpD